MSTVYTYSSAASQIEALNYPLTIKMAVAKQGWSLSQASRYVGKDRNFISQHINGKNISLPLLLLLSRHTQTNLFQPVLNLLAPDPHFNTTKEKELQQQVDTLQKELEDVKKQRDLFKEILLKK